MSFTFVLVKAERGQGSRASRIRPKWPQEGSAFTRSHELKRMIVCRCEDESVSAKDTIYGHPEGMKAVKRIFKSNQWLSKPKEV